MKIISAGSASRGRVRCWGISRSSFSYWRRTAPARTARQIAEAGLGARIRKVHQHSDGTYGAPRVTAELRDEGGPAVNQPRARRQDHADHWPGRGPSAPPASHHPRGPCRGEGAGSDRT
ncbi:IS3 family transposase [Streptomyces sp. NPDC059752]|uniref:IS3 family transposase n=1 Tax=unclassified Streptomyces TaxID=2593676 RepID=UPI00365CA4A6